MFCPNCGTQNPETAQTCTKCSFNLKGAAAPKFKGTMLMQQSPHAAPPPGAPAPAAAPAPMPSKLKGTMVGVAPPMPGSAPMGPPPADPGFPPPAAFGPPPAAPPPVAPEHAAFGSAQGVNPLGGTMVAPDGFGSPPPGAPGGYGAPPQDPNMGAYGAPPQQGFGAPPQQGYGPPPGQPGGYGAPPGAPGGYGAPQGQPDFGQQVNQGFNQATDAINQGINQALGPQGAYNQPGQQPGQPYQQPYGAAPGAQPGYPGGPGGPMVPAGGGPMMGGGGGGGAPGQHGPKGQVRNPINVLLIGIVTCGIYQMIWFISVANEMSAYLGREEPSWVKIMLLSTVTCGIYAMYWQIVKCGALIQEMQMRAGLPNPENKGIMYIVPYYNVILMQQELNKVWESPM